MRRSATKFGLLYTCSLVMVMAAISCKKFIEQVPPPQTQVSEQLVFSEDASALAAMTGIYANLYQTSSWAGGHSSSITVRQGCYADELTYFAPPSSSSGLAPYFFNNVVATDPGALGVWGSCYNLIYSSNKVIEGLAASSKVSGAVKAQLTGEALFVRAFCHFYLVNLFGEVPYISSSDYRANSVVSRTPVAEVYQGIISDLLSAKSRLQENYPSAERVRPNKGAATALLARVYLYDKKWQEAEAQSTELINMTARYKLVTLDEVFLKANQEAIWQLLSSAGLRTNEGEFFILLSTPTNKTAVSGSLYNSFEAGDLRKSKWIDTVTVGLSSWYYPFKYKETANNQTGAEQSVVLRLGEQYLIRAEARAMQDKLTGANSSAADLNEIRQRAGLLPTIATDKAALLLAIEKERRAELFTEWGHRFFDLKRWNRLDAVLTGIKPNWNTADALLPIPQAEILVNKNLTQNPKY